MEILNIGQCAKSASYAMMTMTTDVKNRALYMMAESLRAAKNRILVENEKDMNAAQRSGISEAMLDRLLLNSDRIEQMAQGLESLIALPDPIGGADHVIRRPNGLQIQKRRVPLGVVGIIYEARPNVTADAVGICVKSGNVVILRGGSEAIHSNRAISHTLIIAGETAGLPKGAISFIDDVSREAAVELMRMNQYVDVLIPRGGAGLIRNVVENATVPVLQTGVGNCHIYVDDDADLDMAARILINAKTSRPAVCNAVEKLLIARSIAPMFLNRIGEVLHAKGVEVRGDSECRDLYPQAILATEEDWKTEYSDMILGVKIVEDIFQAIEHINHYGTKHSEAIITQNYSCAQYFLDSVDAAAVYVNASTRFTDGAEFGFGAEMGISTQKLHARGPIGLFEMTTYKYCIYGEGQIRG